MGYRQDALGAVAMLLREGQNEKALKVAEDAIDGRHISTAIGEDGDGTIELAFEDENVLGQCEGCLAGWPKSKSKCKGCARNPDTVDSTGDYFDPVGGGDTPKTCPVCKVEAFVPTKDGEGWVCDKCGSFYANGEPWTD